MSFDGNGNWNNQYSAVADEEAGLKILASRFDNVLLADIKNGFEKCVTTDSQTLLTKPFNVNSHRIINVSDAVNATDAVNKNQLDSNVEEINAKITAADTNISDLQNADNFTDEGKSNIQAFLKPDYSQRISIPSGYTATKGGIAYLTHTWGTGISVICVDGVEILKMDGHSGSSHGQPVPCATVILGAGQTITFSYVSLAYFVPYTA